MLYFKDQTQVYFLVININLLHSFIKLKLPVSTTKYKNLFSQKKVGSYSQVFTLLTSIDMTHWVIIIHCGAKKKRPTTTLYRAYQGSKEILITMIYYDSFEVHFC